MQASPVHFSNGSPRVCRNSAPPSVSPDGARAIPRRRYVRVLMIVHAGTPTSWSRAVPPFFMAQFCHIRCFFMEQSPREAAADTCLWGGGRGTANRQTQTSDYTEANGGQNGMDRPFSLWFHTEPACGKAPLRGRVNERSSRPPKQPAQLPRRQPLLVLVAVLAGLCRSEQHHGPVRELRRGLQHAGTAWLLVGPCPRVHWRAAPASRNATQGQTLRGRSAPHGHSEWPRPLSDGVSGRRKRLAGRAGLGGACRCSGQGRWGSAPLAAPQGLSLAFFLRTRGSGVRYEISLLTYRSENFCSKGIFMEKDRVWGFWSHSGNRNLTWPLLTRQLCELGSTELSCPHQDL